ncbi:TetR/AcrR family transcriptional regulator [Actinoplanes sp. LDG1-06]|uniref:TetR/AcrR family transcriptional regulator n=1 Tax=Paractinoplanes ovalisporus TaxID=2810368 RepID=A0ABS2A2N7_9ACTN|nr:TetR/AcrR family transcriptional regulator [Actinoplanes ovalisporus]MBM2614094.1 TetR/AcrR family transcriptional regulator [Actinoplanes ovalisporus]
MSGTTARRTRGLQTGPRSTQVIENVRAATLAELARAGFGGLTIEGVARAAGVNRTTIYRRWPTKAALLAAVVEPLLEQYDHDPRTGSVRGDVLAIMLMIRDNAARPEGRALVEAVRAGGTGELGDLLAVVTSRAMAPFRRAGVSDLIAHLAFAGVVMWDQTHDGPPGDSDCAGMLDALMPVSGGV